MKASTLRALAKTSRFGLSVFLLFVLPVAALDPNKTLTQYAHRIWGQEEGLFQPTIYSILQTHDGFLWLGTQDSLIRFDGMHFREYDNAEKAGLRRSLIRALLEDSNGNLWVGSVGSGVARISSDGSIKHYGASQGLPSPNAFCLVSDFRDNIWICTEKGLTRINAGQVRVFGKADGLPTNQVHAACKAADGTLWVAGFDFGLSRWNGSRFETYSDSSVPERENIAALECSKDGSVWAGTSNGLTRIKGTLTRSFTVADGLPDNEISALHEDRDGSLWIGTNDGVSRYRNGEISVYRVRDGLSHSLVSSLYTDRESSLWVGTKDGLDQFSNGKVTPYTTNEGLLSNDVGPVLEDMSGNLWVGTLDRGLNIYDGHRFQAVTRRNGLVDDCILSLALDASGDLWVGTRRGLNRLHDRRVVASYTRKDGLSGTAVRALFVDAQGTLWAGTDHGLDRLESKRFVPGGLNRASDRDGIVALAGGQTIRLFVSTEAPGLLYLKDKTAAEYPLDIGHPIDSYYLDHTRHVGWIGTLGSGLLRWKNGVVTHIRVKDGLYDNRIYGILRDDSANFWMASSKGIFRVSEKELQDFADGKLRYVTSIPFSTGQLRFECRSGVQPAAYRTRDGRLWFATTNGLVVLDPNHLASDSVPPPVSITAIVIDGRRVEPARGIRLRPFEKNLEIRYTALSFVSPEKVAFRYMLEGYDKTWTEAGNRREAFFTNLPPGDFRFRVMARNADGVWSTEPALHAFTVEPRFYQRRWFFPLLALLLGGEAIFLYRLRIRRLKQRFDLVLAERSRIARELHDTLLQGLSGITMQLQALWTRLPVSKEKNTLHEIIQDAARCSAEARQSLWGLRTIGQGSLDFSGKVETFCRQAVNGGRVELILKLDPVSLSGSPEIEYQLLKIVQEAVSNSIRHSQADVLEVRLRSADGLIELVIADDGIGFDPLLQPVGHFGIVGIQERAKEIGAKLTIESAVERGTTVGISLNLIQTGAAESNLQGVLEHQIR